MKLLSDISRLNKLASDYMHYDPRFSAGETKPSGYDVAVRAYYLTNKLLEIMDNNVGPVPFAVSLRDILEGVEQ